MPTLSLLLHVNISGTHLLPHKNLGPFLSSSAVLHGRYEQAKQENATTNELNETIFLKHLISNGNSIGNYNLFP